MADRIKPVTLYHVTTPRKARLYRQSGCIIGPVRGFDSLLASTVWAMRTGRTVIYEVQCEHPQMLPDHHNEFGHAWWCETVPLDRVRCVVSANGADADAAMEVSRG